MSARKGIHGLRLADLANMRQRSGLATSQKGAERLSAEASAKSFSSTQRPVKEFYVPTVAEGLAYSAAACAGVNAFGYPCLFRAALDGWDCLGLTECCGANVPGAFVASMLVSRRHSGAWNLGLVSTPGLLNCLTGLWGARLGGYLFLRIVHTGMQQQGRGPKNAAMAELSLLLAGEDKRLEPFMADPKLLATFWTAQAAWSFIVSLPVTISNYVAASRASQLRLATSHLVGGPWWASACLLLWGACFALETVADAQKFAFKLDPENKNRFMASGVWAWSRHPNYAGA
eukprot:scaffold926_cov408-Prasinococcus_capsulatus_cf.AAC.6